MQAPAIEELIYSCLLAPPEERTSRLEKYCSSHPQLEDGLRARFERLVELGLVTVAGAAPPEPVGTALPERLGPFEVDDVIGRGGMGIVLRGRQPSVGDRRVALKVLSPERVADPVSEARFVREGLLAGRLNHPALCPVLDVGREDGLVYLAMPLVEGRTLASFVEDARDAGARRLDLPGAVGGWRAIARLGAQVARGLQAAHDSGLIHRDVKPANIVVGPDGSPTLLDFGLARDVLEEGDRLTRSADVVGTPAYMAPEQVEAGVRPTDARTDVHALGATLFECLSLELPHAGTTRAALLENIARGPARRLRSIAPELPHALEAILATALATSPDDRYASASALADDLERLLRDEPVEARMPSVLARGRSWARRNRAATVVMGVMAAAVLATGLLAARIADESRGRRLEAAISDAVALRAEARRRPALEAALRAHDLAPEDPRTLGLLMQLCAEPREIARFHCAAGVGRMHLHPAGERIAFEVPGGLELHCVGGARDASMARIECGPVHAFSWLPDGALALTVDGWLRSFDPDGTERWAVDCELGEAPPWGRGRPAMVLVDEPATRVAVGGPDGSLSLRGLADGGLLRRIEIAAGSVHRLASVDGHDEVLVGAEIEAKKSAVHRVDLDRGTVARIGEPVDVLVSSLTIDGEGRYAMWAYAGGKRVVDVGSLASGWPESDVAPAQRIDVPGLAAMVDSATIRAAIVDSGRLAVSSTDRVYVYDLDALADPDVDPLEAQSQLAHGAGVNGLYFGADGLSIFTVSADGLAQQFGARNGVRVALLAQARGSQLVGLAGAESGCVAVRDISGIVQVLAPPSSPVQRVSFRHGMSIVVPVWSGDGELWISQTGLGRLHRVDAESGDTLETVQVSKGAFRRQPTVRLVNGAFDPPLPWTTLRGVVALGPADLLSGELVTDVRGTWPRDVGNQVGASALPDGSAYAALHLDESRHPDVGHVVVLRRESESGAWGGAPVHHELAAPAHHLAFVNEGELALGGMDGALRLLDVGSGEARLIDAGTGEPVRFVAPSPGGGEVLACGARGALRAVDLVSGTVTQLGAHDASVVFAVYSDDGRFVATGDATGEVALWRRDPPRELARWEGHPSRVRHIDFEPGGARLVSSGYDGTIAVWPTDVEVAVTEARSLLTPVVEVGGK